jgi:hypothetical protein
VWGVEPGGLTPRVAVLNSDGNPVAAQVVSRDASMCTLQISQADAGSWYVVKVSAAQPTGAHATGRYFLGIETRSTALPLELAAAGTLQGSQAQDFQSLTVAASAVYHFDLSTIGARQTGDAAVCVAIYDDHGRPVESFRAVHGAGPATADLLLGAGQYVIRVVGATKSGAALEVLRYNLRILVRSHAIGPAPIDPTLNPVGPSPVGPPKDPYRVTPLDPNAAIQFGPVASFSNPWVF